MNDFTKEELQDLLSAMEVTRNECGHDDDLINKLQSLIDNYDSLESIRDRTDLHGGLNRR